jgi:hypothetical protein
MPPANLKWHHEGLLAFEFHSEQQYALLQLKSSCSTSLHFSLNLIIILLSLWFYLQSMVSEINWCNKWPRITNNHACKGSPQEYTHKNWGSQKQLAIANRDRDC